VSCFDQSLVAVSIFGTGYASPNEPSLQGNSIADMFQLPAKVTCISASGAVEPLWLACEFQESEQ
jgi:hypothetical protein